jgi:type II restriction/modification system DNA methylase subunit YeeA
LGAHYTDRAKIMMIVDPVIIQPWIVEWEKVKATIAALNPKVERLRKSRSPSRQTDLATATYQSFLKRLRAFRVLDPACGSGNFLYLTLHALKDLERKVDIEAEAMGMARELPQIGPEAVRGIEVNPYAADLARMTVWIGEIQWMRRNGFDVSREPILKPLDTIECRDAILNENGTVADWPAADVIIGNPPFLGGKMLRDVLGGDYVGKLFAAYAGRVPAEADIVIYWFLRAWEGVSLGGVQRVGFVATNSIRGGANRRVLDRISRDGIIFDAWDNEAWVLEGAAVRVSLIGFAKDASNNVIRLDGKLVQHINADLTGAIDLTVASGLRENRGRSFQGPVKIGQFDIPGSLARTWLVMPLNPNGRPNADVVRPWADGMDLVQRASDTWIVDFGEMTESEASLYEMPFEYIRQEVKPQRDRNRRDRGRIYWWQHGETVPGLRAALSPLSRFILTPRISKHRLFVWMNSRVLPDSATVAVARDDDTTMGILHSRFHEAWALRLGTSLEDRPRYTPSTTFETFPFPTELTQSRPAAFYASNARAIDVAAATRRLDELRCNWLNPTDFVRIVPEVVPGYPDRLLPISDAAAAVLKTRTLTNLYNERPAWLANAHRDLDAAVAIAYGWPVDISDEDALAQLLELNQARAERIAPQRERPPTPEQLRRQPELPPMPLPGGRAQRDQRPLPLNEPLLSTPQPARRRRSRS